MKLKKIIISGAMPVIAGMTGWADISSVEVTAPVSVGVRSNQSQVLGLQEFPVDRIGKEARLNPQTIDVFEGTDTDDADSVPVTLLDKESEVPGFDELVDACVSVPAGEVIIQEGSGENPDDIVLISNDPAGPFGGKLMRMSGHPAAGVAVALGIAGLWIRRKLIL